MAKKTKARTALRHKALTRTVRRQPLWARDFGCCMIFRLACCASAVLQVKSLVPFRVYGLLWSTELPMLLVYQKKELDWGF